MLGNKVFEFFCSSLRLLTATTTKMFRNTVMRQAMDLVVIVILKAVVSLKIHVYTVLTGQKNTVGDSLELIAVKTVLLAFILVPSKLRHLNAMQ